MNTENVVSSINRVFAVNKRSFTYQAELVSWTEDFVKNIRFLAIRLIP